jgi:capsule synthesis protein PGA_cap
MCDGVIIQWLGDISLNGPFCDPQQAAALRENIRSVSAELGPCDFRIANWESPLWGDGRMNEHKVPRLATLPHAAKAAVEPLGLDVVLLANNHAYDCMEAGFENTIALLQQMGSTPLGAGRSEQEATQPLVLERRGLRLGLLNYVSYDTHPNLPPGAGVFLNWFDEERALSETTALCGKTDAVLVHLHWGDEFLRIPTIEQRRIVRKLVDAGARVVVGCHAHVLQGHERWLGGYIFHGLGNFLFWPPGAPLENAGPWPRYVREVGVACCRLAGGEVRDVAVRHLVQDGLALRWDETPRRKRLERRLCRSLRLADRSFAWARRVEAFRAQHVLSRRHTMRQAGGFWPWLAERCRRVLRAAPPGLRG